MPLDIGNIQRVLTEDGLDGWLLYDFHGSNPIAQAIAGVTGRHTTRRWFYFIPSRGTPFKLVHAIESGVLAHLPGDTRQYARHTELGAGLAALVEGARRVAMEYSPGGAIPYLSRVDAGTIEAVRNLGVEVVSSGDLVGRFEAAWGPAEIASHRIASEKLHGIKDRTFAFIRDAVAGGRRIGELDVQQQMMTWFAEERLVTDAPPIVAVDAHAGDPHYSPTPATSRPIGRDQLVLIDLWGKLDEPDAVYADITWTGVTGVVPAEVERVFQIVVAARDAALARVQAAVAAGIEIRGFEVDQAARSVIDAAGFGDAFVHRTGHSLGRDVHGNGVHMDDYETHDDRRLLPGTAFTIEPGVYLACFGIRSEINVVVRPDGADSTGPRQQTLVSML